MAKKTSGLTPEEQVLKRMFPDLPTSDDFERKATKAGADDDPAKLIADLQAKIARLEGRAEAAPSGGGRKDIIADLPTPPIAPQVDWKAAPDPVENPAEYARFVRDTTQAQIEYEKQAWRYQQQVSQTVQGRSQALWNEFSEKYGDYAKDAEKVEIAADRAIAKIKAKGLDADKYVYGDTDKFMKDVVAEMDRLFPKAAAAEEDDETGEDDEDDIRTQVFGGAQAGPKGAAKTREAPQRYGALSQEVRDWQQKTGFYR